MKDEITQEYNGNTGGIIRPTLKAIKEKYKDAKVIKSIWGNEWDLNNHDVSKAYKLNDTDIFIPYKNKQNDNRDICVYDYDMNRYAEIIK